jgi:hypothetical protein
MKLENSRHIFEKYSNIKFHENPFSRSSVFPCGRTDGQTNEAKSRFSQFCERTKKLAHNGTPNCILYTDWGFFINLTEVFPCFFLSCKANARVKLAKTGHGPHSSTLFVICVVRLLFFCSMYCLCVNVYCHRMTTQLQLINISYQTRSVILCTFSI